MINLGVIWSRRRSTACSKASTSVTLPISAPKLRVIQTWKRNCAVRTKMALLLYPMLTRLLMRQTPVSTINRQWIHMLHQDLDLSTLTSTSDLARHKQCHKDHRHPQHHALPIINHDETTGVPTTSVQISLK